jgi:hypothetical protein
MVQIEDARPSTVLTGARLGPRNTFVTGRGEKIGISAGSSGVWTDRPQEISQIHHPAAPDMLAGWRLQVRMSALLQVFEGNPRG